MQTYPRSPPKPRQHYAIDHVNSSRDPCSQPVRNREGGPTQRYEVGLKKKKKSGRRVDTPEPGCQVDAAPCKQPRLVRDSPPFTNAPRVLRDGTWPASTSVQAFRFDSVPLVWLQTRRYLDSPEIGLRAPMAPTPGAVQFVASRLSKRLRGSSEPPRGSQRSLPISGV